MADPEACGMKQEETEQQIDLLLQPYKESPPTSPQEFPCSSAPSTTEYKYLPEKVESMPDPEPCKMKYEDTEQQIGQPDLQIQMIRSVADTEKNQARTVASVTDHGYKCYVQGCTGDVNTFHTLPAEKNTQQAWLKFIYKRIPQHFNNKLLVCSAHFTTDSFSNFGQYQAGFAQRLILMKGAVPSVLPLQLQLQSQPQAFQSTSHLLRSNDVGCQTDGPTFVSKATQLSLKTLRPHLRSKAVQATVLSQSVAVGTTITARSLQQMISTPDSRPAKRLRVELEEDMENEDDEISEASSDSQDSTYDPAESVASETESSQASDTAEPFHKDAKFIVFEKCLLSLFENCPVCSSACNVRQCTRGTFISIDQKCPHCDYFRQWKSQPVIGSTPAGNLQLSAATYFSGASFLKMERVFRAMDLKTHTYDAFRKHARTYLEPAVIHKWNEDQNLQLQTLNQNKNVILGGDMKTDSPGDSGKYGSYAMMDLQTKNIVDIQLVQSNEVGGGYHMEEEGLRRSLDRMVKSGVKLDCVVTDRHPQLQKFLKERKIRHCYGVSHMAKGLSKKVEKILREKDSSLVKKCHENITKHLSRSATSSDSGPEKSAKWTSIIKDIQEILTLSDPVLPSCLRERRLSKDRSKCLQSGSRTLNRLRKVLINKRVLSDVEKLSPHYQTSAVESFHKVCLQFAPKYVPFPFIGKLCRLYLAAMHYNENATRLQMTTSQRKAKKGEHTDKPEKTEPTFGYVINLMDSVFEGVVNDPLPYLEAVQKIPVPQYLSVQGV